METEFKNIFDSAAKSPEAADIFARQPKKDISESDIFAGDDKLLESLKKQRKTIDVSKASKAVTEKTKKLFSTAQVIVLLNVVAITAVLAGLLAYIMLKDPASPEATPVQNTAPVPRGPQRSPQISGGIDVANIKPMDKSVSWETADTLYEKGHFHEALSAYKTLFDNVPANLPSDKFLRDFLKLKMALCMQRTANSQQLTELYTEALQSDSPPVRTLANYNLIFIENHKKQFLSARTRAYRTLALLETVRDTFSPQMESDCYFMMAEAMTRQVMLLNNIPDDLPGTLWTDSMKIETTPQMSQNQLKAFLNSGIYQISEGAITPRIEKNTHTSSGAKWTAVCMNAPINEFMAKIASSAEMNVSYNNCVEAVQRRPATICMYASSKQNITEVAAGATGLIARFEGDDITVHNPEFYDNLDQYKQMLTREAISVWRRFLLRYRGDHRTANAHYALGLLQEANGVQATALAEYKYVASSFSTNPLAPFALFNSSKIKTNLRDYTGARLDLEELIIQHPDTTIIDQASLYQAQATMHAGLYDQAVKRYKRVYNLDLSADSRRLAAHGVGQCYYNMKNYKEAEKWLVHAINQTQDIADNRLYEAYFMLGKTLIELQKYPQAAIALKNALAGTRPQEDYVRIILQLIDAEVKQENYLNALNILENVPEERLSQPDACDISIAKARILMDLDLSDNAVSMLRRKIEFIADSFLRAKLSVELSKCYARRGDLKIARQEITEAIYDLPSGLLSQQANLLLAQISYDLEMYEATKDLCIQLLSYSPDKTIKASAMELLGNTYTELGKPIKASQAYAGVFDKL